MPGPMGAGKSTLVAALVRAGLDYLTDEVVAIDPARASSVPYPKYLSLAGGAAAAAPDAVRQYLGDASLVCRERPAPGAAAAREPATPRIVVTPRYEPGATGRARAAPARRRPGRTGPARVPPRDRRADARSTCSARLVEQSACYELVSGDVPGATRALLELVDAGDRVRA